jgi:hypothetical protein
LRWLLVFLLACARPAEKPPALRFFASRTEAGVVLTTPPTRWVTLYSNALVALVQLRHGERAEAGRLLQAMAAVQAEDGSLPFAYRLPKPSERYVRSGAMAWMGYAAVEWLRGGDDARIRGMALGIARYLMGNEDNGLVRGGDVRWASVEHNIDAYFFFSALGRLTRDARHAAMAERIARALVERAWNGDQFFMGIGPDGPESRAGARLRLVGRAVPPRRGRAGKGGEGAAYRGYGLCSGGRRLPRAQAVSALARRLAGGERGRGAGGPAPGQA